MNDGRGITRSTSSERELRSSESPRLRPTARLVRLVKSLNASQAADVICSPRKHTCFHLDEGKPIYTKNSVSIRRVKDVVLDPGADTSDLPVKARSNRSAHVLTHVGVRRLVAKVFEKTKSLQRWVIMETRRNSLIKVIPYPNTTREDAERVRKYYLRNNPKVNPDTVVVRHVAMFEDQMRLLGDEFANEALVSMLVTRFSRWCPHILGFEDALIHRPTQRGLIIMHRADATLSEWIQLMQTRPISFEDIVHVVYGIIFQVAATLHFLQQKLRLKHHDLHDKNVFVRFVQPGDEFEAQDLSTVAGYVYRIRGLEMYVPNNFVIPFVADFGFASATIGKQRIGRIDMSAFDGKEDWGPWNINLHRAEGYDLQVLLASIERWRFRGKPLAPYIRPMTEFLSKAPLTRRFRPQRKYVSRVTPLEFIRRTFTSKAGEPLAVDYTRRPEARPGFVPKLALMMDEAE